MKNVKEQKFPSLNVLGKYKHKKNELCKYVKELIYKMAYLVEQLIIRDKDRGTAERFYSLIQKLTSPQERNIHLLTKLICLYKDILDLYFCCDKDERNFTSRVLYFPGN